MKKLFILGTGCAKCRQLAEHVEAAARELELEYDLEKVTNINEMIKFGVMVTPALVVDDQVKAAGNVPTVEEIKKMLV